jgi:NADPH:quinone reductase-like Zn-dependent oxidoreductase
MEAYRIDRFGSVDGIVRRSSGDPRPGAKEVLMRVRASSLNYRDLMVLKGGGRGPTKLGVVPLSDGAGEVAALRVLARYPEARDEVVAVFRQAECPRIGAEFLEKMRQKLGPLLFRQEFEGEFIDPQSSAFSSEMIELALVDDFERFVT